MKSSLRNMVLVLFTITAISAALVALVNNVTKEAIALTEQKNRDLAKLEVLPSFSGEPTLNEQSYQLGDFKVNVSEVMAGGEIIGYAVEAPSILKNGYADRIYLMVGFVEKADGVEISGVKVLSQKETPGLGANMIKPGNKLEKSILNKRAEELVFEVKKDNPMGSFDALTGSTISSRAYANAVETAYAGYLMYKGLLLTADKGEIDDATQTEPTEVVSEAEMSDDREVTVDAELATEVEAVDNQEEIVEVEEPSQDELVIENNEEQVAQEGEVDNE